MANNLQGQALLNDPVRNKRRCVHAGRAPQTPAERATARISWHWREAKPQKLSA